MNFFWVKVKVTVNFTQFFQLQLLFSYWKYHWCALRTTAWMTSCVTSRQVKASHRWWVCNKLHHPAISPEQGASKIVKISQQMAKLCRKLKWLVFFLGHGVVVIKQMRCSVKCTISVWAENDVLADALSLCGSWASCPLTVKFDTCRNLQRHRAVVPAIARLSC